MGASLRFASLAIALAFASTACGGEGAALKGSWNVQTWSVDFARNIDCADAETSEVADVGTMVFDDVPHPDGIGDHTFTYALTKRFDQGAGAFVDGELSGSAGWDPGEEGDESDDIRVIDPVNELMAGTWTILESALGAVNVEHTVVRDFGGGAADCTRSEMFLTAP